MAAAQHGSSTKHCTNIIGHRQPHKGQESRDNNTSREAATTVSKIESLNEEMENPGMCVLWEPLINRMWVAEWVLYVKEEYA
jgi:hypothetical protein